MAVGPVSTQATVTDASTQRNDGWAMVAMAVAHRIICEIYDYCNDTIGFRGVLWHCNGRVMFEAWGNCTYWHGAFVHNHGGWPGNIYIVFNYRGVRPYHVAYLLPERDGMWVGRD